MHEKYRTEIHVEFCDFSPVLLARGAFPRRVDAQLKRERGPVYVLNGTKASA
jgi:hypothetical protein